MSVQADLERLLARLLTDRDWRERFIADPIAVAQEAGLPRAQAEAIALLPASDLLTAARSYDHKRHRRR